MSMAARGSSGLLFASASTMLPLQRVGSVRWAVGGAVGQDGTHPDFQPKPVISDEENKTEIEEIKADIRATIKAEPVVIFMKGLPEAPVCNFSKKLIDILDALQLEYTSFDVLAHPVIRSYVKEVSQWPTIPQLFVAGEFVGGTDIIIEMAQNGALQQLLEQKKIPHKPFKF